MKYWTLLCVNSLDLTVQQGVNCSQLKRRVIVEGGVGGQVVGAQGQSEGQLCAQHSQQTQLSRTIYNFAQFSCRGMPIKTWSLIRSYVTAPFLHSSIIFLTQVVCVEVFYCICEKLKWVQKLQICDM